MSYSPPALVQLPRDFVFEGRPMQMHYKTERAVVYQQIPPAGPRQNMIPPPIYKFFVFKIERDGEAEILGELILTTQNFTHALDVAARQ
jgi:hypothetical protein